MRVVTDTKDKTSVQNKLSNDKKISVLFKRAATGIIPVPNRGINKITENRFCDEEAASAIYRVGEYFALLVVEGMRIRSALLWLTVSHGALIILLHY